MRSAARRRIILATACLIAACAAIGTSLSGCGGRETGGTPRQGSGEEVVLVVSGDTQGWITPCGCTTNQSGGLPRRASYLAALRKDRTVLYADVGGAPGGTSPYDVLKFESVLKGEMAMGVAAHNLGGPEIALGAQTLARLAASTRVPLVGTNTSSGGKAVAEAVRIVEIKGGGGKGVRVAVLGVVSPKFRVSAGGGGTGGEGAIQVSPPREAILRTLGTIENRYDKLVVLAYMEEEELSALARDLPEADAVIGGPTGQSLAPSRVGPTLVASATRKGKFLLESPLGGAAGAAGSGGGGEARIIELGERFADAPEQLQVVSAFRDALKAADFRASVTRLAPAADRLPTVAGSAACRTCHQAEFEQWSRSGHGHAWESLVKQGAQVDPSCQVCHVTNYGAPGGFESIAASMNRVHVGCESCHGPSAAHAADPKVRTTFMASAQCITCHDQENSPTFAYEPYWLKIRHGRAAAMKEAAR